MSYFAHPTVGIDAMAAYIPHLYLPIETLAEVRNIEYAKLNKGLGLTAMAVPDAGEDAATMMANAVRRLIEQNDLDPRQIGRLYLGTESAIDGAKPTATYALQMLQQHFEPQYGEDCFLHCDVVDLTFACIGAVDALQNTLDWVRGKDGRMGIIVASDVAKYELNSTGEYTQGAGAIATLIKRDPRILAIGEDWGVGTRAVYDFYKPLREVEKADLISEVLHLANRNHVDVPQLAGTLQQGLEVKGVLDTNEARLTLHKVTPVFDGPFSNQCYQQRIGEALQNYRHESGIAKETPTATTWDRLIFHLPYAFQARRMFGEIFWREMQFNAQAEALNEAIGVTYPERDAFDDEATYEKALTGFWRAVTKTDIYRQFVAQRIAPSEASSGLVGNMYAGSIFLALMGTLEQGLFNDDLTAGQIFGFFGYGSGSKSKVFTGELQAGWQEKVQNFQLQAYLDQRQALDYPTYEKLHRGLFSQPIAPQQEVFYQRSITAEGQREYA